MCEERHGTHFADPIPLRLWGGEGVHDDLRPTATMALPLYKHRIDAQSSLHLACAGNSVEAVQEAIAVGRACGVPQAELDDAAAVVIQLRSRQRAGEALAAALQDQDPDSLRQAVALSDKAGLYSQELEKAMYLVEMLDSGSEMERDGSSQIQFREMILGRLEKAVNDRSHKELVESIDEAESTGLLTRKQDRALLSRARVMLNIIVARKQMAKQRRTLDRIPRAGASFEDAINTTECVA